MNKVNQSEYDISFRIEEVSNLNIIDPGSVTDSEGEYLMLTDTAKRQMASTYEMGNKKFSHDLYSIDPDIWKKLLSKKKLSNNVINNLQHAVALIISDTMINISASSTNVKEGVEIVNHYIQRGDLTCYYDINPDTNILSLLAVNLEGVGNLIKYYIETNWVVVSNCFYDKDKLFILPQAEVDASISEEIKKVIVSDNCYNSSTLVTLECLPDLISNLSSTFLSTDEVINFFKKVLRIKITHDDIDTIQICADRDWNSKVEDALGDVLSKLYSDDKFLNTIYSNWIKKMLYITSVSYLDLVNLLTPAIMSGVLDSDILLREVIKCNNKDTHYHLINQ